MSYSNERQKTHELLHSFAELQSASKHPIRHEINKTKADNVLRLADGLFGDVVGMNDSIRLYSCFAKDGKVMYVDYDV